MPQARRLLGQHFLIDKNIQQKIIAAANIRMGDRVVEVGPGRGILTTALLAAGAHVTAIEIDPKLSAMLSKKIVHSHFTLVTTDALCYPYSGVGAPYKIVANLPYVISVPLLFTFLAERARITRMALMIQKEVAERLTAKLGSPHRGTLSVLCELYADARLAFLVRASCFQPPPKVTSAVVTLTPRQQPLVPICNEGFFASVVKGAFGYRRKQLKNALADAGFPPAHIQAVTATLKIDSSRRGETLSLSEFGALANGLFALQNGMPV